MATLSPSQRYLRAYGMVGPQISPEMAFQEVERRRAGQEILGGQKFGAGLPQMLGIGPDGAPAGGAGGGGLGDQYQSAADEARAATDKRDQEIRGILDSRQKNAAGLFARTSGGLYRDIYRGHQADIGGKVVNDAARGFFRSGAGNTREEQLNRSEDFTRAEGEIAQKQALLDASLAKDKADYVERITDQGPDMNQLIGLEQQMGAGGGGAPTILGNPYGLGGGQVAMRMQPQAGQGSWFGGANQPPAGGYAAAYGSKRLPDGALRMAKSIQDMKRKSDIDNLHNRTRGFVGLPGPMHETMLKGHLAADNTVVNHDPNREFDNNADFNTVEIPFANPYRTSDPLKAYAIGAVRKDPIVDRSYWARRAGAEGAGTAAAPYPFAPRPQAAAAVPATNPQSSVRRRTYAGIYPRRTA